MSFSELDQHIFTIPDQPDLIPYRTSYYSESWGFCISDRQRAQMAEAGGEYEVVIESSLSSGTLTWGEYLHVGESTDEGVIVSSPLSPITRERQLLRPGAVDRISA